MFPALLLGGLLASSSSALSTPQPRANGPTAKLTTGQYQGFTKDGIDWFQGIPYAEQPGPGSRFLAARPPKPQQGVQRATKYKDICAQSDGGKEECLYLNVARPAGVSREKKLPVLAWIHGGGFYSGASWYDGDPSAMVKQSGAMGKEMLFVSIDYRLNSFGFLYHPEVTVGNNSNPGLTDQVQALKFLQENLEALGGDPSQVTIWGQSAGATSVEALMLYAPAGLFRATISNSGYLLASNPAMFSGAAFPGDRETKSFWSLSEKAGCGSEGSTGAKQAFSCLQNKDFGTIQQATLDAQGTGNVHWAPVIDTRPGSLLNQQPQSLLAKAGYNKVPMIIGTTKDDGSYFSQGGGASSFLTGLGVNSGAAGKLNSLYSSDSSSSNVDWAVATDWNFLADRRHVAGAVSKTNDTYTYVFSQPGPDDPGSGAHHSADLLYFFGKNNDQNLGTQMQSYWINFVHDLDPNGKSLPSWPKTSTKQDLEFVAGKIQAIKDNYRLAQTKLIAKLQPSKGHGKIGTTSRHRSRAAVPHHRAPVRRSPSDRLQAVAASMGGR